MAGLRTRVANKANRFIKKAQAVPPGTPPAVSPPAPAVPPSGPVAPMPTTPTAPKPAAPKAPPPGTLPPGAPKPKEEIEQDVEKDIRKKKEQESKINDLDEKVTALGDQLEGLTKSINKLVNIVQKNEGTPTDYEKKFEEIKEDKDESLSSNEFGLGNDDDSLIVSKEGHQMSTKEKLRKARKERLEAKELEFHENNPPNKKYKQQVPAPTITKVKDEPEDWGQYRLKAADMALDLNASGDTWSVVNKHTDKVFYTIGATEETKEVFPTEEFAKTIINDVREMGLEAAMEKYSAEPMEFLKKKKEEIKEKPLLKKKLFEPKDKAEKKMPPIKKKLEEKEDKELEEEACAEPRAKEAQMEEPVTEPVEPVEMEEAAGAEEVTEEVTEEDTQESVENVQETVTEQKASMNDYQRRFVRAFRLALSSQQKNLTDNPLKAAWFEVLNDLDVPNPEKVIEATFSRAAAEHFEVTLAKTAEYLNLSDEAFVEMESQIGELRTQPPKTASEVLEIEQHKKATALRARAHNASLALSTVTEDTSADPLARVSAALPKPKLYGVTRFSK